ncbi:MAG: hypothetical protein MUO67_05030 [Anaerolineales bacterium]|nr:hypothetical protein [Anaerolineales bacterium]
MIDESFYKSDRVLDNFPNAILPFSQTLRFNLDNVDGWGAQYLILPRGSGIYSPEEFSEKEEGWQNHPIELLSTPGITGMSKYLCVDSNRSNKTINVYNNG